MLLLNWIACQTSEPYKPVSQESVPVEDSEQQHDSPGTDSPQDSPVESEKQDSPVDSPTDSPVDSTPPEPVHPKVILFIGDGMGLNHVDGASVYEYGATGLSTMESMPMHARSRTASYSGTTDSAASATAMSTGIKTWNGYLGMDQNGNSLLNVRELAAGLGMSTGIITSDTLTGATPAAFMTHVDSRGESDEIAAQIALDPPDVLLGGGRGLMDPALSAIDAARVYTDTEMGQWVDDGRPLFGFFADVTFPFVIDNSPDVPSLADMTRTALRKLETNPDGFFLMVEGARIDHASHNNDGNAVHLETVDFDQAIAAALSWASTQNDVTILVSADHECGGMWFTGGGINQNPTTYWRWNGHTNADVAIYGFGGPTMSLQNQRVDSTWIHAILEAALTNTPVVAPAAPLIPDGYTEDLGSPASTQTWESSYGAAYNQLDALRIMSDASGIWIGVDGVFEYDNNLLSVWMDWDYGAGTGVGQDSLLDDRLGMVDPILSTLGAHLSVSATGVGFDAAFATVGGQDIGITVPGLENAGLRGFAGAWGDPSDFWWLPSASNIDDGNMSSLPTTGDGPAADADLPGNTLNGYEIWIPWSSIFPAGIPAAGTSLAFTAMISSESGDDISNQVLPPLATEDAIGNGTLDIAQVVIVEIAPDGSLVTAPYVGP